MPSLQVVTDLIENIQKFIKLCNADADRETVIKCFDLAVSSLGEACGIPYENGKKWGKAVIYHASAIKKTIEEGKPSLNYYLPDSTNKQYFNQMYNAIASGDTEKYKKLEAEYLKNNPGKTASDVRRGIGDILETKDERVAAAAEWHKKALNTTNTSDISKYETKRDSIIDCLVDEGFSEALVINVVYNYKSPEQRQNDKDLNIKITTQANETANNYKESVYDIAAYKILSARDKADVTKALEKYAKEEAKLEYREAYEMALSDRKISIAKSAGIEPGEYLAILENAQGNKQAQKWKAINESDLSEEEKSVMRRLVKANSKTIYNIENQIRGNN